ncbi:MAG: 50S ribosomal protein L6 [archaeon]|nr:MAG: 50S ribosomal protein L6 [archaeon]
MKRKIEVPKGIETELEEKDLMVKGERGDIKKRFYHPKILLKKKDGELFIETRDDKKKTVAIVGTWASCINNMFRGVSEGYQYRMKISHVHFPMNISVEGERVVIKNFLGQKEDRYAHVIEGVEVKVEGEEIVITGVDKEKVGQTAANIENSTRLRTRRDRRVFSDGIFIISKGD